MTIIDGSAHDVYNGMPASDLGEQGWESPWSGPNGGQCVQTKQLADGRVALRQSTDPAGPALIYTPEEITAFVAGVKRGLADHLTRLTSPRTPSERFRMTDSHAARDIDTSRPHSARMYDFYLGGKDHFAIDRQVGESVASAYPGVFVAAHENRGFMHRATRVLAREHGIRQWLDIGTGIPTEPNLHQVAQSVVADARVVYADNDPLVLKYAERLMRSSPEGRTTYIEADVNDPQALIDAPELTEVLDLGKPVALSLNALMHFVTDDQDPYGIVTRLLAILPSGSALALSHVTPDFDPDSWGKVAEIYENGGTPVRFRTHDEVKRFFDGLDLLDPGISLAHRWRPDAEPTAVDAEVSLWTGVGIKP